MNSSFITEILITQNQNCMLMQFKILLWMIQQNIFN